MNDGSVQLYDAEEIPSASLPDRSSLQSHPPLDIVGYGE